MSVYFSLRGGGGLPSVPNNVASLDGSFQGIALGGCGALQLSDEVIWAVKEEGQQIRMRCVHKLFGATPDHKSQHATRWISCL